MRLLLLSFKPVVKDAVRIAIEIEVLIVATGARSGGRIRRRIHADGALVAESPL